jgi:hypothetical protein
MTNLNNIRESSPSATPFKLPNIMRSKKAVLECPKCFGIAEPYQVPGYDESNPLHYRCSRCDYVAIHYHFIKKDYTGPLGNSNPDALVNPREYNAIRTRRTVPQTKKRSYSNKDRTFNRNDTRFTPTEDPIPLLAGKRDTDLEALLDRVGILVNLQDDTVEEDQ